MKKLTLITKILAVIIICLIGFVGIYLPWKKPLEMNNSVKDFNLSKDLKGYREITLNVSDENSDNLTVENYEKSKSIVESRLKELDVQDYNLSLDKKTGIIYLQIPEDDKTDRVVSNIAETGTVELKDSKDESKTYLTTDNLENAKYFYSTGDSGTVVYLELQFNKEGKEILKDLSENEYKTLSEDESAEEDEDATSEDADEESEEDSDKEEQKQVTLYMSGNTVTTTSFDEPVSDGKIDLSMSSASTDTETINETLTSARTVATILNNGPLPIEYSVDENQYVKTDIKEDTVKNVAIAVAIVVAILLIYMIIKHKVRGLLAVISYIGFIALYLLALRVFNVTIALEGIVGGIIVLILNYLVSMKLLNAENDNKKYYKSYLDIIMKLLPIFAISVIFVYMPTIALSSLGMVMFWGVALILAYNVAVTKHIVD